MSNLASSVTAASRIEQLPSVSVSSCETTCSRAMMCGASQFSIPTAGFANCRTDCGSIVCALLEAVEGVVCETVPFEVVVDWTCIVCAALDRTELWMDREHAAAESRVAIVLKTSHARSRCFKLRHFESQSLRLVRPAGVKLLPPTATVSSSGGDPVPIALDSADEPCNGSKGV